MTDSVQILDTEQRKKAQDPERSCIVQAPAGSGKTTLLANRYVALLARVQQPEQILAITFTKKAAAEMRQRVLQELADKQSALGRSAMRHAQTLGWNIDKYPGRLRIQTIDSFAMSLVKQLPITSRLQQRDISAHPEQCYQQAVARVLRRVGQITGDGDGVATADLLRDFLGNSSQIHNLLVAMLRRREQWQFMLMERLANFDNRALIDAIAAGIRNLQSNALERLNNSLSLPVRHKLVGFAQYAIDNLDGHPEFASLEEFEQWRFIADTLVLTREAELGNPAVRKALNKNQGFPPGNKTTHKKDLLELLGEFPDNPAYRDMLEALIAIRDLPAPGAAELDRERLAIIGTVLFNCIGELAQLFIERREVDFNQITIAAIAALGTDDAPSDLALSLDYRISHLLIDEFQDTSRAQHELFSRLIREWTPDDGNTFFAVGDPMQSIYRFRNAEVSLFLDVCDNGMNSLPLEHLRLTTNFRSSNTMISWFNQVFSPVLGTQNDRNLGSICYSSATSPRGALEKLEKTRLLEPLQTSTSTEEQHNQLIAHIQKLANSASYTDIAILVRNRTPVGNLVQALEAANIPWQGTDLHALRNTAIVSDLVCLSQALFDPGNRISAFAMLRGPLVGLTLDDLGGVAQVLRSDDSSALDTEAASLAQSPVFTVAASELAKFLSPDGHERMHRLQAIARPWLQRRLTLSPRELIEALWLNLGGPAAYPPSTHKHASRLLDVIEAGHPRRFDPDRLQRDLAGLYAEDDSSGVQILTIHKSKGLQFKHVLLPHLQAGTRADDMQLLMSRESSKGFLMACRMPGSKDNDRKQRTLYHWLKTEDKERARNEIRRLLYVAATRAEESLALFATLEGNKTPAKNSLLAALADVFGELWHENNDSGHMALRDTARIKTPDLTINVLPASLAAPVLNPPRVSLPARARRPSQQRTGPELDDPELLFALERRAAILRGNLIHQALCKLSRSITPEVQPLKEPEFHIRLATRLIASEQPIWRQQAIESGLGAVLADQVAEATRQGIERVAHSEVGRWCAMQWHADSQAEFALTLWERAGPLKLVIDRSFVTFDSRGDHTRWIIDYKTAQPDAATDSAAEQGTASSQTSADNDHWLHGELERHSAQLEGYGRALQAMHPDQRLRKALYFTATDALWELAPEGPVTHLQSAELRLPNGTRARLLRHPE